eukprot:m.1013703 g.1013703  ORF g.1013703 m.1013703 type:complete len:251 (-) comp24068_c0_seq12:2252-3004(-)
MIRLPASPAASPTPPCDVVPQQHQASLQRQNPLRQRRGQTATAPSALVGRRDNADSGALDGQHPDQRHRADATGSFAASASAFFNDYVVVAVMACVVLTPRLDYGIILRSKGGNASMLAAMQGNASLAICILQLAGVPRRVGAYCGLKRLAVLGTAAMAFPVVLMASASLAQLQWCALVYATLHAVCDPPCRTIVQMRAPKHGRSAWIGWLHAGKAISQVRVDPPVEFIPILGMRDFPAVCSNATDLLVQ